MGNLSQTSLGLVTLINKASLPDLEAALSEWRYHSLYLKGDVVHDEQTFLAQATQDLPMPVGLRPKSWSGFMDGLWEGLGGIKENQVAIIWTHADNMLSGGLSDLIKALDCLTTLARQVYNPTETGFSREMTLKVFLIGDGPNFPSAT